MDESSTPLLPKHVWDEPPETACSAPGRAATGSASAGETSVKSKNRTIEHRRTRPSFNDSRFTSPPLIRASGLPSAPPNRDPEGHLGVPGLIVGLHPVSAAVAE